MKYKTQIRKRLMWIFNISDWRQYPRPSWFYPTDNWTEITDDNAEEMAKLIQEDLNR